jgi:hypothetical protein
MANKSPIGAAASAKTPAQFAQELAALTNFTEDQIQALFPNQSDAEELKSLIELVQSAADENDKRTKLLNSITSVANVVTKIATKVVI